ncbi:thioredoxin reductase [bacterium BMS3Abin02]|nr:thioredoxin reductase [bacterium BMS3Abin02]HDK45976.1 thioredoxin-disulfide reductase [Actinomycetota bacterium]HDL48513.1 thioredoxin-disulfide reductase [Actinomycetota bacterium]
MTEEVIIIGSGPAGLTAALYAARGGNAPLVLEGSQAGGQLMLTTEVENFPGFPDGLLGPELMDRMRKQAERFGARMITSDVSKVDLGASPFKLWVGADEYSATSIIVSTGASAKWLGIPGEDRLIGRGVSSCATCDGFFFRDQEIIVVGGGDTAMEEALFLTTFASTVHIVHRRDAFRASAVMAQRAIAHPKINVIWDTVLEEVLGEDEVTSVRLRNVKTDAITEMPVSGVFVAIGHKPNTDLFRGQLKMDDVGYLSLTGPTSTQTSVAGVFAAGDVADSLYRQAVTAAGTGARAAIDARRWLEARE